MKNKLNTLVTGVQNAKISFIFSSCVTTLMLNGSFRPRFFHNGTRRRFHMKVIKFFSAIFLFMASISTNAVIVDIDYRGWVGLDYSDEGIWSKDMWQSEVTGKFWYDTELAPARGPVYPDYPDSYSYRSETNSWLNMVIYIDGKVIDISKPEGVGSGIVKSLEEINLNVTGDYFGINKETVEGDLSGDYLLKLVDIRLNSITDLIQSGSLEQNFSWNEDSCCSDMYFVLIGSTNGKEHRSTMELAITSLTATVRTADVPEPSSFSLIFLGIIAIILRGRVRFKQEK